MTATEILRRMLDERGVEWGNVRNDGSESDYLTEWQFENNQGKAIAIEWAVGSGLSVEIHRYHLTPEQVIATTLKQAVRHPKPHEKWTTVLLPEIAWGWDDRWPDYLSVAHDANGEWLVYVPEDTPRRGTCHIKPWKMERDTGFYDCMECECGYVSDVSDWAKWHFCPNCGRRIEQ